MEIDSKTFHPSATITHRPASTLGNYRGAQFDEPLTRKVVSVVCLAPEKPNTN